MTVLDRLTAALSRSNRLERELGAGGMATVYLAQDLRHDRQVAIKVLHEDLGAALGAERYLTEIKTTARLQHPHSGGRQLRHPQTREGKALVLQKIERLCEAISGTRH